MRKLTHGSLFSGIGGFDLAAEWMGWENKFHCEWNEFGQKVLNHYWPNAESFTDITKTDFTKYANKIDILTGGFPCQPYSSAGKRKGKEDERHLWPQMLRAIREVSPRFVVGENVRGLTNWNGGLVFEEVCAELESYGYQVAPVIIPACAVNAPHRRERIWFVAYNNNNGLYGPKNGQSVGQRNERDTQRPDQASESSRCAKQDATSTTYADESRLQSCEESKRYTEKNDKGVTGSINFGIITNTESNTDTEQLRSYRKRQNRQLNDYGKNGYATYSTSPGGRQNNGYGESGLNDKKSTPSYWEKFPTKPPICSGNDGLPGELDGITFSKWRNESIKAYGNAIVPQVTYSIFKAIEKTLYL